MRTFEQRFADVFSELGDFEQMQIFNEWAYRIGDEPICQMEEFDDLFNDWKPSDIAMRMFYGDFNPNHDYFRFDGYGNLESANHLNEWLDDYIISDLADWYEEHEDVLTCVCSEMEEIFEEEEEEKEEETI